MATRVHDLTDAEWAALMDAWGGCAYCGAAGPLQKDCMLPISRGGRYTVSNVVPACRSCNASKCNIEVTTWLRRKKLDESGFLVRQAAIRQAIEST
jgi:5-methylcytosine-specific restriction endonuclease McrA